MKPARKKKKQVKSSILTGAQARELIEHPLNTVINESLITYGKYIVEDRAVPALQDGLKPSQRRILWAMYKDLGSRPDKGYIKSARVEGATFTYHPHSSAFPTLVNMIEGTPCPLVTGYGNFGSFSKLYTPPAASRYSETKLNQFTMDALFSKRFEKVFPRVPSFDGSSHEPVWLPSTLPLILTMGATGIALGVMTNIPAFTTESIYKLVSLLFKKNKQPTAELMEKHLEFGSAYGGRMISKESEVLNLIKTGIGAIEWECEYKIEGKYLHITGLPPGWSYDKKVENIRNLPEVASVDNLTSAKGVDVRVSFKRLNEDDLYVAMDKVKKHLTSKIHYRSNITYRDIVEDELVDTTKAEFRSQSIVGILRDWMKFRIQIEKAALKIEFQELGDQLKHQQLMRLACTNLDIIFKLLKTKNIDKVKELAKKLKISEEESKTIWALPVGRLDTLSQKEIDNKIKGLIKQRKHVKLMHKQPTVSIVNFMQSCTHLDNPIAYEKV